jgi:hypothetical protein
MDDAEFDELNEDDALITDPLLLSDEDEEGEAGIEDELDPDALLEKGMRIEQDFEDEEEPEF